ncbi:MAG: hypothetical protein ACYCS7_15060 [Acidimicrobiales bacterium]
MPDAPNRAVRRFHCPNEPIRLVGLPARVRGFLREMPLLGAAGLWSIRQAIERLEKTLDLSSPRSLIQTATS